VEPTVDALDPRGAHAGWAPEGSDGGAGEALDQRRPRRGVEPLRRQHQGDGGGDLGLLGGHPPQRCRRADEHAGGVAGDLGAGGGVTEVEGGDPAAPAPEGDGPEGQVATRRQQRDHGVVAPHPGQPQGPAAEIGQAVEVGGRRRHQQRPVVVEVDGAEPGVDLLVDERRPPAGDGRPPPAEPVRRPRQPRGRRSQDRFDAVDGGRVDRGQPGEIVGAPQLPARPQPGAVEPTRLGGGERVDLLPEVPDEQAIPLGVAPSGRQAVPVHGRTL
jgi:hypothetical protein